MQTEDGQEKCTCEYYCPTRRPNYYNHPTRGNTVTSGTPLPSHLRGQARGDWCAPPPRRDAPRSAMVGSHVADRYNITPSPAPRRRDSVSTPPPPPPAPEIDLSSLKLEQDAAADNYTLFTRPRSCPTRENFSLLRLDSIFTRLFGS